MTQEGFVSLMLENDDSYMFKPMENTIKQTNDDEFYRELSKQFYAPQRLKCFSLKLKKPVKSTNSQFIQKKFNSHLDAESIRLSALHSSNLKKEQFNKPENQTKQNLQQNNVKSVPKVRSPDFQNPYLRQNLKITPSQRQILTNGIKPILRLRIEDSQQYFEFSQSHRSLLNTSTKSTNKSEKSTDLYFPIKMHADKKDDLRNLFKLSFRCKQ